MNNKYICTLCYTPCNKTLSFVLSKKNLFRLAPQIFKDVLIFLLWIYNAVLAINGNVVLFDSEKKSNSIWIL